MTRFYSTHWFQITALIAASGTLAAAPTGSKTGSDVERVVGLERQRVELIERLTPAVVCVSDSKERGGGSGVIIDPQGYGLTNYHVVANLVDKRMGWGGLSDGKLYELELLGIDPTGDVAMFKLNGQDHFAHVELGDSDTVRVGDVTLAMGNPFALSEDYTPSVSMGLVTGVHRYQWGTGNNLIYSDSIQFDTSINPGSSGGPLFDASGRLMGINGRISVNTRGRFNVGFGYAISINQIKRFMPSMRAGLLARHGTLQATVEDIEEMGVVFTEVLRHAAAYDAGVRVGDRLLEMDGIPVTSRNHFASLIGTYPERWPVWLRIERHEQPREMLVRLEGIPPKLSKRFEPNRGVNVREIERVLRGFQAIVLGERAAGEAPSAGWRNPRGENPPAGWPRLWRWSLTREYVPRNEDTTRPPESYAVSQADDGKARMQQVYEDGSKGRITEYDALSAVWRSAEENQGALPEGPAGGTEDHSAFELPLDARLVLAATYVLQRSFGSWKDVNDLHDVSHVGGEGLYVAPTDISAETMRFPLGRREPLLVEVLEWRLSDHTIARFAFDTRTGLLGRIVVTDSPSSEEAVIDLSDYRLMGGLFWPSTFDVRCGGWKYRDCWSDVNVEW